MKLAVIFAIAMACAMAAPPTPNVAQTASAANGDADGVVKRSPAVGNQNAKKIVRRRPVSVIDANGKLVDIDDDDVKFVTSGFNNRQVAFQPQQASVVSQAPVTSSAVGSGSTLSQTAGDIVLISDDSLEIDDLDDLDDLDDFAIVSPNGLKTFPFFNRQTPARVVSQSSFFNPLTSFVRAPVRQTRMKTRFVQSNNPTTCTCPPQQREPIFQFSRFPQQSVNRFSQFERFPQFTSSSGVRFIFDD
ncbi:uncharacterized protein LOC116925290 [Daphnia magna]|uniref:uncharacterized protein LOC116925290 n=1 Tax=Daphnia magna TaxID=35525 RepID=UPI001E1BAE14|nr:uncharacterized protein LOC116925290 [Daphnia magna]